MQDKVLQPYFLIAVLAGSFVLTFYIFQPFLAPLVLGAIFAVILHPLYAYLVRRFGGRESLAALATVLIAFILILIPAAFLGSQLLREAQQLYTSAESGNAQSALTSLAGQMSQYVSPYVPDAEARLTQISQDIDVYAQKALTWLIQHLGVAFSSVANMTLDLLIFFVALYYLLRDGKRLTGTLVELSPLSDRDDATIVERLYVATHSVVKGKLVISLIQGFLTGIGFLIFGVPNPALWGSVAAIASIVPPIGTALVLAPGVAYLALTGSIGGAAGLAIWGVVAVGLVDNLLGPRLMSHGLSLHPLLVLLSVLGGIAFFGPIGIFLGPLTISLLLVLLSIYRDVTGRKVENQAS